METETGEKGVSGADMGSAHIAPVSMSERFDYFFRSAKYMPKSIRAEPRRNQTVICSWSSHQAKRMVVMGLK